MITSAALAKTTNSKTVQDGGTTLWVLIEGLAANTDPELRLRCSCLCIYHRHSVVTCFEQQFPGICQCDIYRRDSYYSHQEQSSVITYYRTQSAPLRPSPPKTLALSFDASQDSPETWKRFQDLLNPWPCCIARSDAGYVTSHHTALEEHDCTLYYPLMYCVSRCERYRLRQVDAETDRQTDRQTHATAIATAAAADTTTTTTTTTTSTTAAATATTTTSTPAAATLVCAAAAAAAASTAATASTTATTTTTATATATATAATPTATTINEAGASVTIKHHCDCSHAAELFYACVLD